MGRKKPPGARKPGPSLRRGGGESFLRRLEHASPVVTCALDAASAVQTEAYRYLSDGDWSPPLRDDWSLMIGGDAESDDAGIVVLMVYGIDSTVRGMLRSHLEKHQRAVEWDVLDAEP